MKRQYLDSRKPPRGIVGPDGIGRTLAGRVVSITHACEHCDGERSRLVRHDRLRGFVCPDCDSSLDEMLDEPNDDTTKGHTP